MCLVLVVVSRTTTLTTKLISRAYKRGIESNNETLKFHHVRSSPSAEPYKMTKFKDKGSVVSEAVSSSSQLRQNQVHGLNCCYTKGGRVHSLQRRHDHEHDLMSQGLNAYPNPSDNVSVSAL